MATWAKSRDLESKFGNMPLRQRLLRDFILGVLFILSLLGFVANVSYSSSDPSINVATTGDISNWLGAGGANFADFMRQIFGLNSILLVAMIAGICLFALIKGPYNIHNAKLRTFLSVLGFMLFGMCLAALPASPRWSMASGFGGILGDVTLGLFTIAFGHVWWAKMIFGIIAFLGFAACAYFVFNLHFRDINGAVDSAGFYWAGLRVWWDGLFAPKPKKRKKIRKDQNRQQMRQQYDEYTEEQPQKARKTRKAQPINDEYSADNYAPPQNYDAAPIPVHRNIEPKINVPPKPKPAKTNENLDQQSFSFGGNSDFELPRLDLLQRPAARRQLHDEAALRQNANLLMNVLEQYKVSGEIINVRPGPVVTLYELEPEAGIKGARVINLADDIARSMSAVSCRVAVVKGKNAIGIELPNATREAVFLRTLLSSEFYMSGKAKLPMALGETIGGEPWIADLTVMPHLLIAGTTGSGKSVGVNAMILSMLYRLTPDECRFIMIDPKMVELSVYNDIPHLLTPVVTDPKKAVAALKWTVREMENRYRLMSKLGVRNIASYNDRAAEALRNGEVIETMEKVGFDKETGQPIIEKRTIELRHMPYIVVVIDEMADLMLVAGKEIEGLLQRLAQMARAVGIHLITATQRPSVDVITGTIKANFPTRISYMVTSKIDSRTILGEGGAEQLLGKGDLLFMENGGKINRLHGPFVADNEVGQIVAALKAQGTPQYFDDITNCDDDEGDMNPTFAANSGDELFDKAVEIVARDRKVSTSYLQRQLRIGYNRAADLVDRMEREGMVSSADHVGRREILLPNHNE